jgi:hypothetical protein
MHLIAGWTLDRVLILDGQHLERLRIHRKARINQLARSWALDQYAVQSFLSGLRTDEPVANKGPLSSALNQRLHLNRLVRRRHRVGYDEVIGAGAGEIVAQSGLRPAHCIPG